MHVMCAETYCLVHASSPPLTGQPPFDGKKTKTKTKEKKQPRRDSPSISGPSFCPAACRRLTLVFFFFSKFAVCVCVCFCSSPAVFSRALQSTDVPLYTPRYVRPFRPHLRVPRCYRSLGRVRPIAPAGDTRRLRLNAVATLKTTPQRSLVRWAQER